MKIGILTLPLHTNYGGILQAYALQTVLERMGHDVRLISKKYDIEPGLIGKIRHILSPLKSFVMLYLLPEQFSKDRCRYTRRFVNKWIKKEGFISFESIPSNYYDAIVVGSDQIWRKSCAENFQFIKDIRISFLSFARNWNIKRISYAASFGTDKWEYDSNSTRDCSNLIRLFNAVSVREDSGVSLCNKYLNCEAIHLIDPTLLLSKSDYLNLINKKYKKNSGIMVYILDENEAKITYINELKKETGKPSFVTNIPDNKLHNSNSELIQPPLEKWLQSFEDADIVVTDSFHACVFSIIFNKPFIVIVNIERGASRFYSLLKMLNQEFRIVDTSKPLLFDNKLLSKPDCELSILQEKAISFLRDNLE